MIGSERQTLSPVYSLPETKLNIASCSRLDGRAVTYTMRNSVCYLTEQWDGTTFANIATRLRDGMFLRTAVHCPKQNAANDTCRNNDDRGYKILTASVETEAHLSHLILGHANMRVIHVTMKGRPCGILPSSDPVFIFHVSRWNIRESVVGGSSVMTNKTVTIDADICIPMRTSSCGGNKYFFEMTAGEQKYVRAYFLKNRSSLMN